MTLQQAYLDFLMAQRAKRQSGTDAKTLRRLQNSGFSYDEQTEWFISILPKLKELY